MDDRAVNAIDKLNDSVEELTEVIRAANLPQEQAKHVRIATTLTSTPMPVDAHRSSSSSGASSSSGSGSSSNMDGDVTNQASAVVAESNTIAVHRSISVTGATVSTPASGQGQGLAPGQEPPPRSGIKWEDENNENNTKLEGGVAAGGALSVQKGGQGLGLDTSKDLSGI